MKGFRIMKKLPIWEIRKFNLQNFAILIIWLWSIISPFLGCHRKMILVFLEFLGHGEFKFHKSCQKLYPSLRYYRLVFIPFFGTPCIHLFSLSFLQNVYNSIWLVCSFASYESLIKYKCLQKTKILSLINSLWIEILTN